LYSFHTSQEDLDEYYEKVSVAYTRIFERVGLGESTYKTFASGGIFSKFSHEFQTISDTGEDTMYVHEDKKIAVNKEVLTNEVLAELGISRNDLVEKKAIEVGNIFKLGTRFSEPLELSYVSENGEKKPVIMGSYGIGPGRLMGTIVESLSDDKGIIWPKEVSPFAVHLLRLGTGEESLKVANELYADLRKKSIDVLYDDRDLRPGEKFADSDLIGIPVRLVISDKTLAENKIEIKYRTSPDSELVTREEVMKILSQ